MLCRRPSLSMTPQPVRSVPQSMPNTRTWIAGRSGQRLHLLLIDVEVRVDALHVVVLLESLVQLQHRGSVLSFEAHRSLRNHSDFRGSHGNAGLLDGVEHGLMRLRSGDDLPVAAVVAQILAARFKHDVHELIFGGLVAFDYDLTLALELPGHAA